MVSLELFIVYSIYRDYKRLTILSEDGGDWAAAPVSP